MNIVELHHLHFRYPGHASWLLQDLSLCVTAGERIGIVGDNGCGKSTIAKLLLGILRPTSGHACLYGKPVTWHTSYPTLGYIGDPGHNAEELGLPEMVTVGEALSILRTVYADGSWAQRLSELAEQLGLNDLTDRQVRHLSTGERKRLMACMAFAKQPRLLLLDEPTEGLDREVVPTIRSLIASYLNDPSHTVIYITHNVVEIDNYTDRVFELTSGVLSKVERPQFTTRFSEPVTTYTATCAPGIDHQLRAGQIQGIIQDRTTDEAVLDGFVLTISS